LAGLVREGRVGCARRRDAPGGDRPVAAEETLGSGWCVLGARSSWPGGAMPGAGRSATPTAGYGSLAPRRAWCTGCGDTHVLLPVMFLVRRADTTAVIGPGLTAKAAGPGTG
jgi:hypothetical protein